MQDGESGPHSAQKTFTIYSECFQIERAQNGNIAAQRSGKFDLIRDVFVHGFLSILATQKAT
jgi:hypothetical protein